MDWLREGGKSLNKDEKNLLPLKSYKLKSTYHLVMKYVFNTNVFVFPPSGNSWQSNG